MNTKEQATREGKKLLKLMKTKGWKLDVWENLGWHYCIYKGRFTVYGERYYNSKHVMYSCLLSDTFKYNRCGSMLWSGVPWNKNPNILVKNQIKRAQKVINRLQKCVNSVKGVG